MTLTPVSHFDSSHRRHKRAQRGVSMPFVYILPSIFYGIGSWHKHCCMPSGRLREGGWLDGWNVTWQSDKLGTQWRQPLNTISNTGARATENVCT